MNKFFFSLCMGLMVSISIFFTISYNIYHEKENSDFILPQNVFKNSFIQEVILVSIPTGSAFLTSLYVTNTWQIRKEKLELQRKILGEVDNSIVKCLQILKNFNRMLWSQYTTINSSSHVTNFPTIASEFPENKFKNEYKEFLSKYSEETFGLWKCSSTIKLYYDEELFNEFDKIVKSLEPTLVELQRLILAKDKDEFNLHHTNFMTKRKAIESQINKFKENLVKGKIKKLNV